MNNQRLLRHLKQGINSEHFFNGGGQLTEHPHYNFGYMIEFPRKRQAYVNLVVSISVIRFEDGLKVFGGCYWEWPLVRLKENGWIEWTGQDGDLEILKDAIPVYFTIAIDRVKRSVSREAASKTKQPNAKLTHDV